MSHSQPQPPSANFLDGWSARVSRACASIVVFAFLPHAGRAQPTPRQRHAGDQTPFNAGIESGDGVRAVTRACLRGWHKWRRGAGTAMTSLGFVVVLVCVVLLDCRRRSPSHRALGLPCGVALQSRQRQLGSSQAEVPSTLSAGGRQVLRECDLDSVSQLVRADVSDVPDRCAICLDTMAAGFRDAKRGGGGLL
ncbi:hypothetical protein H4218_002219 [Coemansia sp. IMI 209128]|nr:hypothetical protein H4218_002219 [Coemansia sp. IMI 209128]